MTRSLSLLSLCGVDRSSPGLDGPRTHRFAFARSLAPSNRQTTRVCPVDPLVRLGRASMEVPPGGPDSHPAVARPLPPREARGCGLEPGRFRDLPDPGRRAGWGLASVYIPGGARRFLCQPGLARRRLGPGKHERFALTPGTLRCRMPGRTYRTGVREDRSSSFTIGERSLLSCDEARRTSGILRLGHGRSP
jgi:hypothetical protein